MSTKTTTQADPDKKDPKDVSRDRAKQIAKARNVATVYVNPSGEFFTEKCYALASVGGAEKKLKIYTF